MKEFFETCHQPRTLINEFVSIDEYALELIYIRWVKLVIIIN